MSGIDWTSDTSIFGDVMKSPSPATTGTGGNMWQAALPIAQSFMGGLGGSLGGKSAAPQNAESQSHGGYLNLDGGAYTVATGGSKANGGGALPWYVWAIVGVVAIKYVQKMNK